MLTQDQALQILGLFGGQYPWNDVNGYLLALDNLGLLVAGSVASSESAPSGGGADTSVNGQVTSDTAAASHEDAANA